MIDFSNLSTLNSFEEVEEAADTAWFGFVWGVRIDTGGDSFVFLQGTLTDELRADDFAF